jgi:hypothetical protein
MRNLRLRNSRSCRRLRDFIVRSPYSTIYVKMLSWLTNTNSDKMSKKTCFRCSINSRSESSPGQQVQRVWSCGFLPGIKSAFSDTACLYCNKRFQNGQDWTERLVHLAIYHRYRKCSQHLCFSQSEMEQHLMLDHHYTAFDWLQSWVQQARTGLTNGK